jgi:hypothetical protein
MNPNFNIFRVKNNLQKTSLQKMRVFNLGESIFIYLFIYYYYYFIFLLNITMEHPKRDLTIKWQPKTNALFFWSDYL